MHVIKSTHKTIGYISADFDLKNLPLINVNQIQSHEWRQIKGDPSIRGTLFQQVRSYSIMDKYLNEVLDIIESLMTEQGVFIASYIFPDREQHYGITVILTVIEYMCSMK